MKIQNLFLTILLFVVIVINPLNAATYTINQNDIISLTTGYVNSMTEIWEVVSTVTDKPLKITYSIGTETNYDYLSIYAVDNNGYTNRILRTSGTESGVVSAIIPNGRALIKFTSDGSVCYASNPTTYWGINITFSVDEETSINENLSVTGNSFINGKLGIGGYPNQSLYVKNGKVAIQDVGATVSDEAYNGGLMITKPATSGQYINLVRETTYPWSIGTVYNTSTFAIGKGYMSDAAFTAPFFNIDTKGNVGIGTTVPTAKLDVRGAIVASAQIKASYELIVSKNDSNIGGTIILENPTKTGLREAKEWKIFNMGGTYGNSLQFWAYDSIGCSSGGMCSNRFTIMDNGKVGIGTSTPDNLLTVNGIIHAKEIKVDLTGSLADYVFSPEYELMPLQEVESFVKTNNHLPDVPSAAEVKENGLNMGEMQNKLLQKVEELTLYVIEQQKQIDELKKQLLEK
ncbi:MAG: hypothetical protein PHH37_01440 [Paludibacter sp.]|nr:hypothetical protein [Paludibacter sp.]